MRSLVLRLLDTLPTPKAVLGFGVQSVESIMLKLGIPGRFSHALVNFSEAFVCSNWTAAYDLPGVGRYCADSYTIFCEGRYDISPLDPLLAKYCLWAMKQEDFLAGAS
eukprot:TRINITY_DN7217_c0_g1_i1.p2 TRINITY_DN7217_c0_g1~~TRINITY_DN7217_c0_g1_i1.p2  ORF type:complete len:108 (-),score=1.21 TRINITY_DN7217_c0_g1_i1:161-484(-)